MITSPLYEVCHETSISIDRLLQELSDAQGIGRKKWTGATITKCYLIPHTIEIVIIKYSTYSLALY